MTSKDNVLNVLKHCRRIIDEDLCDNLESEIELANIIELELSFLKKKIQKKIENNAQILKIAKMEYSNIIKSFNRVDDLPSNIYMFASKVNKPSNYRKQIRRYEEIQISNLEISDDELVEFVDCLRNSSKNIAVAEAKSHIVKSAINNNLIFVESNDIGFDNQYTTYSISSIDERNIKEVPFDMFIYDKSINQIVMKIGDTDSFALVNTKLCKVYPPNRQSVDNSRSIICNNNIQNKYWLPLCKEVERKNRCDLKSCRYYHDPFLGDKLSCHTDRQFSNNPIVFSSNKNSPVHNFKSGDLVKENVKKTKWHEAVTLYQSSLANLLIACIHAKSKK